MIIPGPAQLDAPRGAITPTRAAWTDRKGRWWRVVSFKHGVLISVGRDAFGISETCDHSPNDAATTARRLLNCLERRS